MTSISFERYDSSIGGEKETTLYPSKRGGREF